MRIKYVQGDLFHGNESVIIHGCNAKGAFGAGFAKIVKSKYPKVAEAYYREHKTSGLILGSVIWASDKNRIVGNCITQATYGRDGNRHVSYDAIRSCMKAVNTAALIGVPETIAENGFENVGMPMIGSDLAGGDWKIISGIIEEELTNVLPVVYVLRGPVPNPAPNP